MDYFSTFFELGLWHVASVETYATLVFLLALVALYQLPDLKQITLLILVFSLGQSLTLALATTGVIQVDKKLVALMIPLAILITAFTNLARGKRPGSMFWPYIFTALFGLVFGLFYSTILQAHLAANSDIFIPILAFTLGIDAGMVGVVVIILLISVVAFQLFRFKHRDWILVISGATLGLALLLLKKAFYWPVSF